MRETRCGTFELWSLLGRLLAQPMLAVCLAGWCIRPSSHTICVMVPSILPMVAWRVALGCSCIWLLYVALTTAHTGPKQLAAQCANLDY